MSILNFTHGREYPKPVKQEKKRKPLRRVSAKQAGIKESLHRVYTMMDLVEEMERGMKQCRAYPHLNSTNSLIDHSHTLSQARCKEIGKPELISDPENIVFTSRLAHSEWDNYDPAFLKHKNFDSRMAYLKEHDEHSWNRRMEIWAAANPVKDKTI